MSTQRIADPQAGAATMSMRPVADFTSGSTGSALVRFVRRRPLVSFFIWFFSVGQAFAFYPLVASNSLHGVPPQTFILGSTLFGLLLPTVVITYLIGGSGAVRFLWHRIATVRVAAGWYALALLVVPLLAIAITIALEGPPVEASLPEVASLLLPHFVLPLLVTLLPNNLWEEVAWTGFVQTRLQAHHGPLLAAMITGVLFALQHVSLALRGNSVTGTVAVLLLLSALAIPFRFLTGWLYNRTASLLLVGVVHAAGNAVAGGSGFQAGYLAALYPQLQTASAAHLLAFAFVGLVVVIATRSRL
jgi:membrane protease YdiL (CAAX protease family)